MHTFSDFNTPQLKTIHKGKVRDSIRVNNKKRLIVVTDRISAFNKKIKTAIPHKGAVLNGITNFWFDQTKDIIPNHLIKVIDPNISLVHEAVPIRVEMIVRGYLTGSMWRGYEKGQRDFSGALAPDGMTKNQAFAAPILTPTTKDEFDTEINEKEIIKSGLVKKATYQKMKETALALFKRGSEYLDKKGIILVDTKYEFGLLNGKLILIDEIHTPDSSRFWKKKDYKKNPNKAEQMDKEFVRQWMLANKVNGEVPLELPTKIVNETSKRYRDIYELVTGQKFNITEIDPKIRAYHNLVASKLIKPGFIAICMGSKSDLPHVQKIQKFIEAYNIKVSKRIISAHKNGERILELAQAYNESIEPVVVIAVAGRSNGLGGALAANLTTPVINCPPFSDKVDIMANINSSLMMPSNTPASTVIHPDNAALAAVRALNIPSIRQQMNQKIKKMKEDLQKADNQVNK